MNVSTITNKVEKELEGIDQVDLLETIRARMVPIRVEDRDWDYGKTPVKYPCYIVLEDRKSNTAVAYCEDGFGPSCPWGLIFTEGENMSMGMDSAWFSTLEEAVRDSMFWDGSNPQDSEIL